MRRLIQIHSILILPLVVAFAEKLPNNLVPLAYQLQVVTNLADEDGFFNFTGTVVISIKCISPTDSITLHSKNLKIDEEKAAVKNLNQTEESVTITEISDDADNDFLILKLSQALQADLFYEVKLDFLGVLEEEKVGYYRTSYIDDDGMKKWIAVTYFKPNHARRAFPCFDEPKFKATFTLSLGRTINYNSISNVRTRKVDELETNRNWDVDRYVTSPPMSTYNLGYAVMDFKYSTLRLPEMKGLDINLKFYGRDDAIGLPGHNAMKWSMIFLYELEIYFDRKLPLQDMTMIAIPEYPVPVREGFGFIIWQEEYLLELSMYYGSNPQNLYSSSNQATRQWIEGYVTIKSWTDLWFIEGLCMYLSEVIIGRSQFAQLGLATYAVTDSFINVLNLAALQDSEAISIPENENDTISNMAAADPNTQKKAYLFIRMLGHIVGYENLQRVFQKYLKDYAYGSAGSEELLEIINSMHLSPNMDMKTIMDTWFSQGGVPLITVTRNYMQGTLEVKQERFFRDTELLGTDKTKWWIPLAYTTECEMKFNETVPKKWLSPSDDTVTIESPISPADWVIFNSGASSLYVVNYDEETWNVIIDFLNQPYCKRIPPLNRVLLIDNAARLAWIGRLSYRIFFDMLKYLERERKIDPQYNVAQEISFDPPYAALRALDDLNTLLRRTPIHGRFTNYVKKILKGMFRQTARSSFRVSARNGKQSRKQDRRSEVRDVGFLALLIQETILCIGDITKEYSWNDFMKYKDMKTDKLIILWTLGCSENETLLRGYLENSLNEESVGKDDVALVITAVVANKIGFALATQFLEENFKAIYDKASPNLRELWSAIIQVAHQIVTDDELSWWQSFMDTNQEYFEGNQDKMGEALKIASLNVQWHHNHYQTIELYLADEKYNDE